MLTFESRPAMLLLMGDLACLLESGELPGEFDMSTWHCGTAGCAHGWGATLLPSWESAGLTTRASVNNNPYQLTQREIRLAFQPWLLSTTDSFFGHDWIRRRYPRPKVARIIRWLVTREQRRQADEHVRRLNRLAKCAAWGMGREELAQRARERRRVVA